jgi:hypothetical protein
VLYKLFVDDIYIGQLKGGRSAKGFHSYGTKALPTAALIISRYDVGE